MHHYMKTLKTTIPALCVANGCTVEHLQVKGSVLLVHLGTESQIKIMHGLKQTIRDMIDADGAGYKTSFDSYDDRWSKREGYKNTQGIEAEVMFSTINWGI